MRAPRYDKVTRVKIRKRIKTLFKDGLSLDVIHKTLQNEGFTAVGGGELTRQKVQTQMASVGLSYRAKKRASKKIKHETAQSPITVVLQPNLIGNEILPITELIVQSGLSEAKKIAMIRALVNA